MNLSKNEIKDMFLYDNITAYEHITDSKISFDTIIEIFNEVGISVISSDVIRACAFHKDCTLDMFKYIWERSDKYFLRNNELFIKAKIFSNFEAVCLVLKVNPTINDVRGMFNLFLHDKKYLITRLGEIGNQEQVSRIFTFNPFINETFMGLYAEFRLKNFNDKSYLPTKVKSWIFF